MTYDPRTIALQAEILFPPVQLRLDLVQGIHNQLFRHPVAAYQNFQMAPDGIHLTNSPQQPGQISSATYLPDRIVLREEFRISTVEEFAARMVQLVTVSFEALGVGTTVAQQFVIRSLITPRHSRDGRGFLLERVLPDRQDSWQPFGREPITAGLRLGFPPATGGREHFQLRVETWPQDPRSLWLENTGSFPIPTAVDHVTDLGEQLHSTYAFLTGPCGDFLSRFDRP